jgi:hypothetical protein
MMTKLSNALVILSAMAAIGFASAGALAGEIKDSGSFDGTYAKRDVQGIPDQEGHMLLLTESSGISVNQGGLVDGFSVSVREIADLRQGTGAHQGYVIYSKGFDQEVVKFDGMVTTTMKDGKPNTAMKGKYSIVSAAGALAGIKGEGTYSGYFTAEDKFHLDWEGNRSGAKEASADSKK